MGRPARSVSSQGRVDQSGAHHGVSVMGKLSVASNHPEIYGGEEGNMIYVQWGERYYAVTSNGDIFDSTGRIEIVPEGLAKAIKEAGIHEEANSNG